jgi:hypothetical protein
MGEVLDYSIEASPRNDYLYRLYNNCREEYHHRGTEEEEERNLTTKNTKSTKKKIFREERKG